MSAAYKPLVLSRLHGFGAFALDCEQFIAFASHFLHCLLLDMIYFISAAHNHWCYLVWIIPMNWLLTLKRLLFQILCKRVCLFIRLSLWKNVTQILRRISNALPTVYYLTLLYIVPFRFFPFPTVYTFSCLSALLVKGIAFCCYSCYCSYILLFCLFYSFVPIQLREKASLFHPRIKEI